MKTQTLLIIGGLLAAGGAAFYFWRKRQGDYMIAAGPGAAPSPLNPNVLNQPSQVYPYSPAPTTRQDNASQPWYGGARPQDATASMIDPNLLSNVQSLQAISVGTKSLGEIWNNLGVSDWFSDDSASAASDDAVGDWNWDWSVFNA